MPDSLAAPAFRHATLRILSAFSVAYAILGTVASPNFFASARGFLLTFSDMRFDNLQMASAHLWPVQTLGYILLLAGGIALWTSKRRGRTLVLCGGATLVGVEILNAVFWFVGYSHRVLPPAGPSPGPTTSEMAWQIFWFTAVKCAFPLLVFSLLLSRDVASLWSAAPHTAFEVVPTAARAPTPQVPAR